MVKVYIAQKDKYTFEQLVEIIRILRSPGGCPWDREQTHKSIRNEFIEETYEAADAIDRENSTDLCEELGDVLLQILLHAQMASEKEGYDISDVIDGIARKMILRHPHVFGDVKAETTEAVLKNWDNIKREEKHQLTLTDTLKSVPMSYPSLMRAAKVQKRADKAGFTFETDDELIAKAQKKLQNIKNGDTDSFGELLFTIVTMSRNKGVDCEETLNRVTSEFIREFEIKERLGEI